MPFRVVPGAGRSPAPHRLVRLARFGDGILQAIPCDPRRPCWTSPSRYAPRASTRVPLEDAKRVKDHFGATLNDVAVATRPVPFAAGCPKLGELPATPMVALVPQAEIKLR
jgi:diacylglycerol O-acyltransferase / wax synthase